LFGIPYFFTMKFNVSIFILLFSSSLAKASLEFNYNCRKAYEAVTSLKFSLAQQYIDIEKKNNPSNKLIILTENYRDCMTLILNENKNQLKKLGPWKELRLSAIAKENKQSPYYLYTMAEINMHWAFAHIKNEEYLSGVLEISRAYKLLNKNVKQYPGFTPQYKSLGLLHSLIGVVPDEYKWAVNLLGFEGSLKEGNKELQQFYNASFSDSLNYCYQSEATLMLGIIQLNFIPEDKSLNKILSQINTQMQLNPVLSFIYADICMHQGNSKEAAHHLMTHSYAENVYYKFHYLNYLLGQVKLYHLEADAPIYLEAYVNEFKGNTFIKAAYLKLAYYYLLHQNEEKYKFYIQKILTRGNEITDEDKAAQKEAKNGVLPNLFLLKSRLLFDGGYYNESYTSLIRANKEDFKTTKEQLEFIYRLGRIQHKKENYNKAIYYYQMAVKNGSSYPYYFAANAALNLGLIYEELENTAMAKQYYEQCLKMRDHEYQRSIDQKAKAGLKRLSN
jgi:hypothetical protein